MRLPLLPAALLLAGSSVVFGPPQAAANSNVKVSRFWHNHQPIYWPEWNSNWNGQPDRVQFARDSMTLKAGQVYDSGQPHPDNDLDQIFSVDDRKKAYQDGPKDSLAKVGQNGGYAISYSGSLINNVHGLGRSGYNGYSSGWWDGNRTARTWTTPAGSRRLDLVGFTYHHSLGSVLPKSVFRKEIQIFHEAATKAWNTGSITNRSKGFFPTEMAFSRHMVDVLADEGYQWVIVASHHLSRTLPGYMGNPQYTLPQSNSWRIFSSPPNRADQINSVNGGAWWYGTGNVGETAYNHAPFAYQLHRAKYVDPETGAEKTIIMVPSDDVQSYKAGYSGWQKNLIDDHISPHATDPSRPCIVLPSTDGDNAWGGGNDSWQINAPAFMNNGTYPGVAIQDFVNQFGGAAPVVHMEDGAWIFPESCYGSPQFLKWVEPPAGGQPGKRVPNTQVDMETPGFTPKFYSWAPVMAGANWCETAEQMWTDENGTGTVQAWKIQDPYNNLGSTNPASVGPNIVERAWHIYLAGLDSGFNYYGGEGNDDEVKTSLATRRAHEMLQSYVEARKATSDRTPPTVFKPQRFPYNPGGYTYGWFNITPTNGNALKKMKSEFYIWTHAYDVSGITNIIAKVRLDNDGNNPLASNQNETYAGGPEVGNWVSIPMTKRVLPQTAAALTAAANNSKIAYFEGARSPVVADYYFARIDDASLPDFRGKLVDYFIEATDTRGNVSKSDIQHVFVEDDGETPSSGAEFSANPNNCEPVTVTYSAANGPLAGTSPVYVQRRFDDGAWTRHLMTAAMTEVWTHTFDAVGATSATVWFENADGSVIDSRNGANWTTTIRDCNAPDGPVWTVPFTPVAGQPVTINYNPEGRNLSAAQAVNIHHGYNGGNWTVVPGVAMTKSGSIWTYTYTVPAQATSLVMVFNHNANTWDNNGGQNFTLAVSDEPAPTEPPPVPGGLSAGGATGTSVTLTWNAAATATGYEVFRDGQQVGVTSSTTFNDTGLAPGTNYSYRVLATNGAGDSALTPAASATTLSAPLAANQIVVLDPSAAGPLTGSPYLYRGRAGSALTNGLVWTNPLTGGNGLIAFAGGIGGDGWEWTAGIALGSGVNEVTFSGSYAASSTQILTDSPANYSGWSNGVTGGTGFAAWALTTSGSAGHFLASNPANMNVGASTGFGLWANGGGTATAARNFSTPMAVGDNFALRFDNNWVESPGEVGFALADSAGNVKLRFYFVGGQTNYRITDASAARDSGLGYTTNGLSLTLTLGSDNAYTLSTGGANLTGTLASAGGAISRLVVENKNAGPDTERNLYFGAMTHTRQMTDAGTVSTIAPAASYDGGIQSGFDRWRGEEPASADSLLKYAIGGAAAPQEEGTAPQASRDEVTAEFVYTAIVREDAALAVVGETTGDLATGGWTTAGVTAVEPADQSAAPDGCKIVEFRVPAGDAPRFLRLKVTHAP